MSAPQPLSGGRTRRGAHGVPGLDRRSESPVAAVFPHARPEARTHHLYLVERNDPHLHELLDCRDQLLACRDQLRPDGNLRKRDGHLKQVPARAPS